MLAYSFPLLSLFWAFLTLSILVVFVFFIIWCLVDDFKRTDYHGFAKAGWLPLILFFPVLGALLYVIARPAEV